MISGRRQGLFHVYFDNKVPMVSMPNVLLRNDACQSDAARQECLTQVYEESSEKSG